MKKKIKDEIKLKTIPELNKIVKESEELLFKLRLDKSQNKLKNQRQIFWERKRIALVLTLINEKEEIDQMTKDKIPSKRVKTLEKEKDEKRT